MRARAGLINLILGSFSLSLFLEYPGDSNTEGVENHHWTTPEKQVEGIGCGGDHSGDNRDYQECITKVFPEETRRDHSEDG